MSRTPKFSNADDIIDNCTIVKGCFIWPASNMPTPQLSPAGPLSKLMHTNSVARILFAICRFPPASTRLVRWCNTPFCVNPYHHTEARTYVKRRVKQDSYTALLPSQVASRHLAFPSDDILEGLKPKNPYVMTRMVEAAAEAGQDARKMPGHRDLNPNIPVADPKKPVLVMRPSAKAALKPTDEDGLKSEDFFSTLMNNLRRARTNASKQVTST